ncbi:hypothetical protein [Streptosporangium sp. NBC_01756]|uniref:hypothetical protein n=1 Tax=Streptosporangium sp. NBC_01756 TaxID=2975950 RepID=UPI002DD9C5A1|nr:hypothetical protein [Streptosporangium sp. NBC_01756]WSC90068.1 hypothetical protein OIE48_18370 [Streptosporangium sp. NBC_01756]
MTDIRRGPGEGTLYAYVGDRFELTTNGIALLTGIHAAVVAVECGLQRLTGIDNPEAPPAWVIGYRRRKKEIAAHMGARCMPTDKQALDWIAVQLDALDSQ